MNMWETKVNINGLAEVSATTGWIDLKLSDVTSIGDVCTDFDVLVSD